MGLRNTDGDRGRAAGLVLRATDEMTAYAGGFSLIVTGLGIFLCVRAFLEAETDLGRLAVGAVILLVFIAPFFVSLPVGGVVLLVLRVAAALGAYIYLKWKGHELF